ncbi:phosphoribosylglycinamide formyltransferase, formyltetrahydrofolate-dependent [Pleurocapsa sp. PCC 7327]|uniref:phosphoribosylglycinamide formyltransferase n=1 Tax=Pleurocapsa sp. PCC 7327 TaxID=118163 RepID=UPI00029F8785|nr:phosphoribosylglycinamide formyltransferase [Pleurocapsa sp. PCC 7327]AFY79074.1 phosphoribosylglycinamide formyltransferase, formyltetrahydrofolate-dependent [Pleurocapsa sp. PCC 7327]
MTVQLDKKQNSSTPALVSPTLPPQELHLDRPLKLGVMASGSGTNFEVLAQAIRDKKLNAQIQVLIYNNPEAKVKERAEKWGIPAVLLDHRAFKRREDLDRAIVEVLQQRQVEWVIMAGWMRIVTPVLLEAFANRVINIHPSLLPSFKGVRAVEQALEAGVKITGCTVHIATLDVDSGPILMQAAVPILPDDTPQTLHERIQVQEHRIFPVAIALAAKKFGT